MNNSQRHTFGWAVGGWLVTLQVERVERAATITPDTDANLIDWDALAEQYGVPVSSGGDCSSDCACAGLQLCAGCGKSVAPGTGRFDQRIALGDFVSRVSDGYPNPAGAYLCRGCGGAISARYGEPRNPTLNQKDT